MASRPGVGHMYAMPGASLPPTSSRETDTGLPVRDGPDSARRELRDLGQSKRHGDTFQRLHPAAWLALAVDSADRSTQHRQSMTRKQEHALLNFGLKIGRA